MKSIKIKITIRMKNDIQIKVKGNKIKLKK